MIKTRLLRTAQIILIIAGLAGCKTYYIPVDSFKSQFSGIDSTKLKLVHTRGPIGEIVDYLSNPIENIQCVDKNNNPTELKNSPSLEIRFTENNNKQTTFYFDRVYLHDTLIIGVRSRFIGLRKSIPINNIKMIEIQDGHKNFKYVD